MKKVKNKDQKGRKKRKENKTRIGTQNVLTLLKTGKMEQAEAKYYDAELEF